MPRKKTEPENSEGVLVTAAKAIGRAAGKAAAVAGLGPDAAAAPAKKGRLPKKHKQRLPRRQKKAQKKAQSRT